MSYFYNNPILLSSSDYTIYANGQVESDVLGDMETITISTNAASPTIMSYDGFIIYVANNGNTQITINGVSINQTGEGFTLNTTVCVKKGDSVYMNRNPNIFFYGRFYKFREL